MKTMNIDIPKEKLSEFCKRWGISEFAFFGSVLRDDFNSASDIDVLVSFDPAIHISLFNLADMQLELQEIFSRNVDLVTQEGISTSKNYLRKKTILSTAQVIYDTRRNIFA